MSKSFEPRLSSSQELGGNGRSTILAVLNLLLLFGITIFVYPTTLNPGLPIVLGAFTAGAWAMIRLIRGMGPSYSRSCDLVLLLLFWQAMSTFLSVDPFLSQRSLANLLGAVGLFVMTCCAIGNGHQWRTLSFSVVIFATITSLLAWPPAISLAMQTGDLPPLKGTFNNQDTFSIIPMMGLLLGLGLVSKFHHGKRWTLLAIMAILFVSLLATGCRSAMLGFVAAVLFFVFALWRFRQRRLQSVRVLLALPLLSAMILLPTSNFEIPILGKWASTVSSQTVEVEKVRVEVLRHFGKAVLASPILGSGPGTFGLSFQRFRPNDVLHDEYINLAHNDPIEIMVESGLVGFALWFGLFILAFRKLLDHLKRGRRPVEAAATLSLLVALVVFSLFNFLVSQRPTLWLEFLALGLAFSFPSSRNRSSEPMILRGFCSTALIALACWAALFGWRTFQADQWVVEAHRATQRLLHEESARLLNQALALQPQRVALLQERAQVAARLSALTDDAHHLRTQEALLQQAHQVSPLNIPVTLQLADLKGDLGQIAVQGELLAQATALAPGNPEVLQHNLAFAWQTDDLSRLADLLLYQARVTDGRGLARLRDLVLVWEAQDPGAGLEALDRFEDHLSPEHLAEVESLIQTQSEKQKQWPFLQQLVERQLRRNPGELCLQLKHHQVSVHLMQPEELFLGLQKTVKGLQIVDQPCAEEVFELWLETGLALGQQAELHSVLEEQLAQHQRLTWLQVFTSRASEAQGNLKRAVEIVNSGLQENPYSFPLLVRSGDLYRLSGQPRLAINAYQEALSVRPKDPLATRRLKELGRTKKAP